MTSTPLLVSLTQVPGREAVCEPITIGVPFPAGMVGDLYQLSLEDEQRTSVPIQARITERWPDGSIRWALVDFQLSGDAQRSERELALRVGHPGTAPVASPLTLDVEPRKVIVDTGPARFVIKTGLAFPFTSAIVHGVAAVEADGCALVVTTPEGRTLETRTTQITVEESGPLRAVIKLDGSIGPRRHTSLRLTARLHFFAGSGAVRVSIALRNVKRAEHPGGIWELGADGSIYLRDVSLRIALPGAAGMADCAHDRVTAMQSWRTPFDLYQDSSGGEHWRHRAHVDRHGEIPCTFRGYRLESDHRRLDGDRATPVVLARHATGVAGIAVEHFWQNWPKGIAVQDAALIWRLFPGHTAYEHELQGGEQKRHHCTLMFGNDPCARDARAWGRAPAFARMTPEWYCASNAVSCLTPAGSDRYQQLVDAAIEGADSLPAKREAADEYGWRHFGDIHADHENAFSGLDYPVVSHYNNQYDAIGGFAVQFMRSGDRRWHTMLNELAWHVTDIDVYHTDRDKSAYNHGLFWHTAHYVDAGRSTHRSFPRHPRVNGGGPSNEHNYAAGLRLHWLLTGDPQSRETAIDLAGWVIRMDDGRRTPLRWLSTASTGLASQTYSPSFHGPGRGAGNSILALLTGHRLTHDELYLAKAEELVRRCIHPHDNIDALQLLDAERRWSYTVFLQVLAQYLDYRAELGRIDEHYAYGRAALLHYARWMVANEYPYLTKPEILEYPTETWAAQDMRKCDVLLHAAGHGSDDEREGFRRAAAHFFEYSISTLHNMPGRTLARPLVLMLSNGYLYLSGSAATAQRPLPPPVTDFGAPSAFVPQKSVAKRRIGITTACAAMVVAATLLALL